VRIITITNAFKAGIFALLVPAVLIATEAGAAGQGILSGDIFQTENVTAHQQSFTDPNTAKPGDTIIYRVAVGGTVSGAGSLKNAAVKVQFPADSPKSNVAKATVSADNAASVTDSATVNLSQGVALTYVPGSTKLLDKNGSLLTLLPDTIISSGVSVMEQRDGESVCAFGNSKCYVQFEMTSNMKPTTPSTPPTTQATTPATPTPSTPLATAGPDSAAGAIGLMSLSAAAYGLRRSKHQLKQVLRQK
jgi:hypothetical protein